MYEKETGSSISEMGESVSMNMIVEIAYAGMKASGEKVTKDFIIDAIDEDMGLISVFTETMQSDLSALNNLNAEAKK